MPSRVLVRLCVLVVLTGVVQAQTQSADSFEKGRQLAIETVSPQPDGLRVQADGPFYGYLIAEGDSWFAYPGLDVLAAFERHTLPDGGYYKVYSAASAGDTVESMAYDDEQLRAFAREFGKVRDAGKQSQVKAILLSGGGNDLAGSEFFMVLNHSRAVATGALDDAVADALVDRVARSVESLIGSAVGFTHDVLQLPNVPVIIHGYSLAVPDGRPYGIGGPFPGPWLQPGFTAKGYSSGTMADLQRNTEVMAQLIRKFNRRLASIPAKLAGRADVRYVDLTGVLNNTIPANRYKQDWSNELHPTDSGFVRVAAAFHRAIVGH